MMSSGGINPLRTTPARERANGRSAPAPITPLVLKNSLRLNWLDLFISCIALLVARDAIHRCAPALVTFQAPAHPEVGDLHDIQ